MIQAVLMVFVLDTAIGFGVWLPFTFGKTTALLSVGGIGS
jgi:E3 ubiquitin-protein ligase MARCH6